MPDFVRIAVGKAVLLVALDRLLRVTDGRHHRGTEFKIR